MQIEREYWGYKGKRGYELLFIHMNKKKPENDSEAGVPPHLTTLKFWLHSKDPYIPQLGGGPYLSNNRALCFPTIFYITVNPLRNKCWTLTNND